MTDRNTGSARQGFDLVQADPAAAERVLNDVLAAEGIDAEARVIALWGLGRLAHDRGAIAEALTVYTEATGVALDAGLSDLAAEVRVSWSVCLQAAGRTDLALEQLSIAEPHLAGGVLGRLHMQRGYLLTVLGERTAAIDAYDTALPLLLAAGDELAAARSISNRGVVLLQLGRTSRARADLLQSQEMAARLGQHVLAAGALHNLAYLEARSGRFPTALRGFAEAREHYAQVGSPGRYVGDLDIDECGVLIEAGLAVEAEQIAVRVVDAARRAGNTAQLAEALVMLARSRALLGDDESTASIAAEAAELFAAAGRSAWAALARSLELGALDRQPGRRTTAVRQFVRLRDIAGRLERHGWLSEAAEVRILTGRHAIAAGRGDIAGEVLRDAAAARRHPLARVRADAWYAAALLADAAGDRSATRRALDAGLRSVDAYRSTLGATQLRSHAGRFGEPLAAMGLRLALESRSPDAVLRWAEKCRAASFAPVVATDRATERHGALDELREARLALADAQAGDDPVAGAQLRRVAELEEAVARRALHRPAAATARTRRSLDLAMLRRELGAATLVEFVENAGRLHAVVIGGRPPRLVEVGDVAQALVLIDHLAFALRRLSLVPAGPASARHLAAVADAATELDDLLLAAARPHIGTGPLIIVPTGALHAVLWSALPAARRPGGLSIAPSATWWRSPPAPRRRPAVLLVAGPDIGHADREVHALAEIHRGARVLAGREATAQAVGEAMANATLVHIAAHGTFRSDNPMFSTLQLHDGPLSVHDLEALARLPETVVLSSCSTARSGVLPGDELLGTSAALMSLGVRTLVAPLLPVADHAVVPLGVAIHRGLRRGDRPAVTLGRYVRTERGAEAVAAAASFVCFAAQQRVSAPSQRRSVRHA